MLRSAGACPPPVSWGYGRGTSPALRDAPTIKRPTSALRGGGLGSLHLFEQIVQTLEAAFPELAVALQVGGRLSQGLGRQSARPPLPISAARDQTGLLQHLQMLGDGRLAHREGGGKLVDGSLAVRQPSEDRATGRIGESGEDGIKGGATSLSITV